MRNEFHTYNRRETVLKASARCILVNLISKQETLIIYNYILQLLSKRTKLALETLS